MRIKYKILFTIFFSTMVVGNTFAQESIVADSALKINNSIFNTTVVYKVSDHIKPWAKVKYIKNNTISFFVSEKLLIATNIESSNIASISIRNAQNNRNVSAVIRYLDQKLKFALIEVEEPIFDDSTQLLSIIDDPQIFPKLTQLHCVSLSRNGVMLTKKNIYMKGIKSYHLQNEKENIPSLLFSGWEKNISSGDLLLLKNQIVGVVLNYDYKLGYGNALPSLYISQFIHAATQDSRRINPDVEIIENKSSSFLESNKFQSILQHSGFDYEYIDVAIQKKYFKIQDFQHAILVNKVYLYGAAYDVLFPNDLIVEIDDKPILQNGFVYDEMFGLIDSGSAVISKNGRLRNLGETVTLRIIRKGELKRIQYRLFPFSWENYHIPPYYENPGYYILNGMVFLELSGQYLEKSGKSSVKVKYLNDSQSIRNYKSMDRYVILDALLPISQNQGYQESGILLESINGVSVRNLVQMANLIKNSIDNNLPIHLKMEGNRDIVVDSSQIRQADQEIREKYGIQFLTGLNPENE